MGKVSFIMFLIAVLGLLIDIVGTTLAVFFAKSNNKNASKFFYFIMSLGEKITKLGGGLFTICFTIYMFIYLVDIIVAI